MRPMHSKVVLGGALLFMAPIQMLSKIQSTAQPQAPRYRVKDLGTFGGANSYFFAQPTTTTVNNKEVVVGGAETLKRDSNDPNCFAGDCLTVHAFRHRHGGLAGPGYASAGQQQCCLVDYRHRLHHRLCRQRTDRPIHRNSRSCHRCLE